MALDPIGTVTSSLGLGADPLARREGESFSQYLVRMGAGSLLETAEDRRRKEMAEGDFAALQAANFQRFERAERQIDSGRAALEELQIAAGQFDPSFDSGGVLQRTLGTEHAGLLQLGHGGLRV